MRLLINRGMERVLRASGILAAVGAAVCGLWLLSVHGKELVAFKDTAQAIVTAQNMDENGWTQVIEGQGNATHMGLVSVRTEINLEELGVDVDPEYGPALFVHVWGTYVATAANGDKLNSDIDALYIVPAEQPGHFLAYIRGTREVTGGTGRFKAATGSMTVEGTDEAVPGMTRSLITLESEGTLSSVGANKK